MVILRKFLFLVMMAIFDGGLTNLDSFELEPRLFLLNLVEIDIIVRGISCQNILQQQKSTEKKKKN